MRPVLQAVLALAGSDHLPGLAEQHRIQMRQAQLYDHPVPPSVRRRPRS